MAEICNFLLFLVWKVLVPFFTTMQASGVPLDDTILTGRSKRFFRHLKIQNPSIIARFIWG